MSDTPSDDPVARYYDRNTLRFLLVGGAGATYAIHRQLWGPDVTTTVQASDYVNRLLIERIRALDGAPGSTILDLGCGVGGTLLRLGRAFPTARLHGITISARQHEIAQRLVAAERLSHLCALHLGDFHSVRLDVAAHVVVAIESFVHAESAERFFQAAAAHLRPGGHLLLADDFLVRDLSCLDDGQRQRVADFRAGWRVPALSTVADCTRAAAAAGLERVDDVDLTPMIRLGRPRDRVIAVLAPLFGRLGLTHLPFFGNMVGGDALRTGLREGFLTHRLLGFRRAEGVE